MRVRLVVPTVPLIRALVVDKIFLNIANGLPTGAGPIDNKQIATRRQLFILRSTWRLTDPGNRKQIVASKLGKTSLQKMEKGG